MEETKLSFKRYEIKYLLSAEQFQLLMTELADHIMPDEYHESTVCSLYYDTDDYRLIRHSLDRPIYKEKLRLRSYGVPGEDDPVFVELKKKYKGIVYKRRISLPASQAAAWLAGDGRPGQDGQMVRELEWFLHSVRPAPRIFIACERTAWRDREDPELRITFDRNLRWRETELDLRSGARGEPLLPEGTVLMELKIPGAAPFWLAHLLSALSLYPTSFSKVGTAYTDHILQEFIGVTAHA